MTVSPVPEDVWVRLLVAVSGLAILYALGWRTLRRRGRGDILLLLWKFVQQSDEPEPEATLPAEEAT